MTHPTTHASQTSKTPPMDFEATTSKLAQTTGRDQAEFEAMIEQMLSGLCGENNIEPVYKGDFDD